MATLVLTEIFPPRVGGSGRWLHEIYSRLDIDNYLIVAGEHDAALEFDTTSSLSIKRLPLSMSAWGLRSFSALRGYGTHFLALRRICREAEIDMIHCGRSLPEGWLAYLLKRFCGIPYVCYIHGEDVECAAESRELKWMTNKVLRHAEKLIANSQFTGSRLKEAWEIQDQQLTILNPGVDTVRFCPLKPGEKSAAAKSGEDEDSTLLTVGRLQKRKGHDVMIQALPTIRNAVPNIRYNIVGSGEEQDGLAKLAESLGVADRVHFYGEIIDDDLPGHYQNCDLFVLPNRQIGGDVEGFGMVLVEAQACGRPVLAGASGGTADTMVDGRTGARVDCRDPQKLAAAVIALFADRSRLAEMGRNGREWVTATFEWSILAKNAVALFEQLPKKA